MTLYKQNWLKTEDRQNAPLKFACASDIVLQDNCCGFIVSMRNLVHNMLKALKTVIKILIMQENGP